MMNLDMLSMATPLAASAAIGMYLEAKTHFARDARMLFDQLVNQREYSKKVEQNRQSIWYLFEDQVNRMPENEICLWSRETGDLTWQQVHAQACRYAEWFKQEGVQPHQLVGFFLTNSAAFIFSLLACWALGTAPAMINYNLTGEALLHCLKTAECKLILVDEDPEVRQRIEDVQVRIESELGGKLRVIDGSRRAAIAGLEPSRPGDEWRETQTGLDSTMLLFTSGTTGFPKAVPFHIARTHAGGTRFTRLGLQSGPNADRWYIPMPMYHGTGGNTACMSLIAGLTLCVGKKFSTSTFWDDIRASRATGFVYVGESARYLLAAPPSPRDKEHNVKMMFGNGMRPDVWRRFQERFGVDTVSEFFNSTEGVFQLLNVSRGEYLATAVGHHGLLFRLMTSRTMVPVAVDPVTNEIWRDPKTGFAKQQPYEVGGEMIVAVESDDPEVSGFRGYYKNPTASSKKFVRDVFKKGDMWFRSGDALRRDNCGRWFFLDRLGDTFRWKSENVSTAEVAVVLGQYPGVVEANVYGVLVPKHDGRAGCAAIYISPEKASNFDYGDFLQFLRSRLPRYAVPVFLRVVGSLNPMHNNKQNKVPLREEGVDLEKIRNGVSPNDRMMFATMDAPTYRDFGEHEAGLIVNGKAKL